MNIGSFLAKDLIPKSLQTPFLSLNNLKYVLSVSVSFTNPKIRGKKLTYPKDVENCL